MALQLSSRGLFGRTSYRTPGIGDGIEGVPQVAPVAAPEMMQTPGFQRPGTGRMIAGTLGDALQTFAGGRATFAPALQHREQAAMQQAQYQRETADRYALWERQKEWERNNPAPSSPYRWESNDGSLMEVGADGQPRTVYKDPTPKINWIRADNGDGTFQMVPVGPQGPMTPQTQQPAAGGILKSLPPGVKPIGGAGSGGSRTFPIR